MRAITASMRSSFDGPIAAGAIAIILTAAWVTLSLLHSDWDPTIFLAFGADGHTSREHAELVLKHPVAVRPGLGHDGQWFFHQARDPLVRNPELASQLFDSAEYRYQRMLYPLIGGLGGALPTAALPWSLLALSITSVGLATSAAVMLARAFGASERWALAVPLLPGVLSEVAIGGSGNFALAMLFFGVLAISRSTGVATTFFVLAVLAREAMLLGTVAVGVHRWTETRSALHAGAIGLLPVAATVGWAGYLRWGIDLGSAREVLLFSWPLHGLIESITRIQSAPLDAAVAATFACLGIALACRAVTRPSTILWAQAAVGPFAFVLSPAVWGAFYDISRVYAGATIIFMLAVSAEWNSDVARNKERRCGIC